MSLGRVSKLFAAQNATQIVSLLTQLLLPPIFLHSYGVTLYGEWLALSAAIGYLSTVNYGLQTYTNMQMTIHYSRGEVKECIEVQSAGLRILLALFGAFAVLLLVIFALPLDRTLHLTIPRLEAQWVLYLLGVSILANMLQGFFSGNYMVFGETHRGVNFSNVIALLVLCVQVALAMTHRSFAWIAGAQLVITLASCLFLVMDLRRLAPQIAPTLRYWVPGSLKAILKPSAHYGLLFSSNVLAYQLPVLLMQRILGPAPVVVYSVTRTVYSMSRRILFLLTSSIGPEVTISFGQRDWPKLHRLYELSERVILLLVPAVTFGSMLVTPFLLRIWLHKGDLYDPDVCLLLGLTMAILGIKEHKYQFQFSSNQVKEVSYMTPVAYTLTLLVSIPLMHRLGLVGFLIPWAISELLQLFYLLHLNAVLFRQAVLTASIVEQGVSVDRVNRQPVYLLLAVLALGTLVVAWPVLHLMDFRVPVQLGLAAITTLAMLAISYRLFRVDEVRSLLWDRVVSRFPALTGRRS
jgi:O-antigen/teichoic acid export membrane protein